MHSFTLSTWTIADTERKRERLARVSDDELIRDLEACIYLCSSDLSGRPPRQNYVIQRELVRLEICKRGAAEVLPVELSGSVSV
jgi:hypothetical protein